MLLVASPLFDADDLETIRDCQRRTNLGMVRAGLVRLEFTRVFLFLGLGQRMLTSRVEQATEIDQLLAVQLQGVDRGTAARRETDDEFERRA